MSERHEIQRMLMERIDWLHGIVRKRIPAKHSATASADDARPRGLHGGYHAGWQTTLAGRAEF